MTTLLSILSLLDPRTWLMAAEWGREIEADDCGEEVAH